MSDFQKYKKNRMKQDPNFWSGYDERLETFKLGIMLKQARLDSGLTQEQIAKRLKTPNQLSLAWKIMLPISDSQRSKNLPRLWDEKFMW